MLDQAIEIAIKAHKGQKDKGGKPYILHPLRIAMRLRTEDEELMCIAILHDTIEDSDLKLEDLVAAGFSNRVVRAVDCLTKIEGEPYETFIKRCGMNEDARKVKLEDLRDNSDITRLKGLSRIDFDRMEKYQKAYIYLK